jgi:phage terminase large subunit
MEIVIPHNFKPREYQIKLWNALDTYKRAVCIWHRRAGKDKTLTNIVIREMVKRVGAYYYFFPTYQQGKKILWNGMDKAGFRFIDHFPKELIASMNDTEMVIKLKNGSLFQVIGTDNINSIVGTNPVGCVFSEYSLQDPQAWDFIRPILAENGGWAIFNYTPRGTNHGKDLYNLAEREDNWFAQKLTVDDTNAISKEILEQERKEMLERTGNDALFMQEYYCSFDAPVEGAYYGSQMMKAEEENRITNIPYEENLKVNTYWDLGVDDSMTIWFLQSLGKEKRLIDYLEVTGEGLTYCIKGLFNKPYVYGEHFAPRDIKVRELSDGKSRLDKAQALGVNFQIVPDIGVEDGIDAVRSILGSCWFDKTKCARGIDALRSYHKEWDEKNKVYKNHPKHDWASHGSDAFRYLAVGFKPEQESIYIPETEGLGGATIGGYTI